MTTQIVDVTSARPLIIHSHLRWDFVWQRPQQLMSRFARNRDVLFVEEPVFLDDTSRPKLEITVPQRNVHRAIPVLPTSYRSCEERVQETVRTLLRAAISASGALASRFSAPVQWFYTPMPAPFMIGAFGEAVNVYDCMDELANFRFAPNELVHRERFLLARADVVFAGGRALADAKSRFHGNVHFFGCGVDAAHFGRAREHDLGIALSVQSLTKPVLGYVGVIDERLDYALLAHLADQMPEASIAMVGPVVKVNAAELPRRLNIHWLGQRDYQMLPSFIKGFDVCLMPFAINKATEYINPTKTLEYMATGKPIVSTPVPDVVRNFAPIVTVAGTAEGYLSAVRRSITAPDAELSRLGIARASESSWDAITTEMTRLMERAVARARGLRAERVSGMSSAAGEYGVPLAP